MSDKKTTVKLKLSAGDTPVRVLSVLEQLKHKKIYCELASNFVLITELDFLKKVKEIFGDDLDQLHFVTQKSFFGDLLKKQGFNVLDHFPRKHEGVEIKIVRDFLDRVLADKNKTEPAPKPETEPTESTEKGAKSKAQFTKRKIENLAREKSWRGLVFFVFLGLIVSLLGLFFFISPRAEIIVKPRIDTIETTQNIIIALAGAEVPDTEKNLPIVPAILVETEIADTDTFASTRKEYELTNARGKVTLFNEDREAKFLVPSRLSTDEGLIFRTQSNHTIPGATDDGPGSLEVIVVADEYDEQERPIGDRGNIANGTNLFLPALRDELQKLYYAKADRGPLVEGSTLTRYFVDETDVETSQRIIEGSFRVRGLEALREEISQRNEREEANYILLDQPQLIQAKTLEFLFPTELIGQEKTTFQASARYKIGALVFDQAVVLDHLTKKLRLSQDQRKKIVEIDQSTTDYRLLTTEELEEFGWIKLSVSIVGVETIDFEADNTFAKKWREAIKREVVGRELPQARGILVNHPEVEEVLSLKIMPFWNKVVPSILDQIDLQIRY